LSDGFVVLQGVMWGSMVNARPVLKMNEGYASFLV
jgi:hypothetical protein